MRNGRIAIVYPWANLDTVPSLCNTVQALIDEGYCVEIFTHRSRLYRQPEFRRGQVELFYTQSSFGQMAGSRSWSHAAKDAWRTAHGPSFTFFRKWYGRFRDSVVKAVWRVRLLRFALQLWLRHQRQAYCCFIGVDPRGLVQAHRLRRFVSVPVVYYSLELLLQNEIESPDDRELKEQEERLSERSPFVIIQDEERAQLLIENTKISRDKVLTVPNAPPGPARLCRRRYWHERFNLLPEQRIVFHGGSVEPWTGIEEIISSVRSWASHWVLVIHTRYDARFSEEIDRLRGIDESGAVLFSLQPVSRDSYDCLIDSADIGIAFYVPMHGSTYAQGNIQSVGLSSGKIAYYLRSGLPVIVNKTTSIAEMIVREECGISVKGGSDIDEAIGRIAERYDYYSRGAGQAFDRHFSFQPAFERVMGRIRELDRGAA